eukprot:1158058-Pelagomonas_calceolata.AAC.3
MQPHSANTPSKRKPQDLAKAAATRISPPASPTTRGVVRRMQEEEESRLSPWAAASHHRKSCADTALRNQLSKETAESWCTQGQHACQLEIRYTPIPSYGSGRASGGVKWMGLQRAQSSEAVSVGEHQGGVKVSGCASRRASRGQGQRLYQWVSIKEASRSVAVLVGEHQEGKWVSIKEATGSENRCKAVLAKTTE